MRERLAIAGVAALTLLGVGGLVAELPDVTRDAVLLIGAIAGGGTVLEHRTRRAATP